MITAPLGPVPGLQGIIGKTHPPWWGIHKQPSFLDGLMDFELELEFFFFLRAPVSHKSLLSWFCILHQGILFHEMGNLSQITIVVYVSRFYQRKTSGFDKGFE